MCFDNLGKDCALKECQQKDYLPFECKYCKQFYCLEHRSVVDHNCYVYNQKKRKNILRKKTYYCFVCKKKTMVEWKCKLCSKNTCFKHFEFHDCSDKIDKKRLFRNWFCW